MAYALVCLVVLLGAVIKFLEVEANKAGKSSKTSPPLPVKGPVDTTLLPGGANPA
jgi:hypothetical protein